MFTTEPCEAMLAEPVNKGGSTALISPYVFPLITISINNTFYIRQPISVHLLIN